MILLKQMMIFGIMMAAGYVMARKNILDEKAAKAISWLIVNIANPALILSGCIGNTTVSYTHLDVYKRQLRNTDKRRDLV